MEIKINVENQGEINKYFQILLSKNKPALRSAITTSCILLVANAQKIAPVDTGRLKNSIVPMVYDTTLGISGVVGTNVKYAPDVEFGTNRHLAYVGTWAARHGFSKKTKWLWVSGKAHPFLEPSFENSFSDIAKIFSEKVRGMIQ